MKIKVCGMKHPENIEALAKLSIDFMGLIFYNKSQRFVESLNSADLETLPTSIKRVGVFVDADIEYIIQKIEQYNLDLLQLHGNESVAFCKELKNIRPIIKAFNVSQPSDFEKTKEYEGVCEYVLFDTKTSQHGGSGLKFDWAILDYYKGGTLFFLSGGISADDAESIKEIQHPKLYGIDLNSRFEIEPGLKDIELLKQFIKTVKDEQD